MTTSATWEKSHDTPTQKRDVEKLKFLIGGSLVVAAILYLIAMNTFGGVQYFLTVDELLANPDNIGKTVRISGAVIGETIMYDSKNLIIDFTVANIPLQNENLAYALYLAAHPNSTATRLSVHIENQVKPDLLQNEAQAILTGKLGADGIFYATEILLKCPSRYEDNVPGQAIAGEG